MKNKLKINLATGIYNIFITVICIIAPIINFTVGVSEAVSTENPDMIAFLSISTFFKILFIFALALNIISLILSKKNNIKITGHICGIVGAGIYIIFGGFLSIASFVLFILASIWVMKQDPLIKS